VVGRCGVWSRRRATGRKSSHVLACCCGCCCYSYHTPSRTAIPPFDSNPIQHSGNGIVYRYLERQKGGSQNNSSSSNNKGNKGTKRAAASTATTAAPAAASSSKDGGSDSSSSSKRRRVMVEAEVGQEGQGEERLKEEVRQLRAALVGATQGAEGIFKVGGLVLLVVGWMTDLTG
jgi:cobalamin biosynthesis Mg chelatase CobN